MPVNASISPWSTLADQVGACAAVLRPLHALVEDHVLNAKRLHGNHTTVPIVAKAKTNTGRAWVYVRDDRLFGGGASPAVLFYASRDPSGDYLERHVRQFAGILQADAYAVRLRYWSGLPIRAVIAANARRGEAPPPISPIAFEVVKRIDPLFDIERGILRLTAEQRRQDHAARHADQTRRHETSLQGHHAERDGGTAGRRAVGADQPQRLEGLAPRP
jgi:hypothetical protein